MAINRYLDKVAASQRIWRRTIQLIIDEFLFVGSFKITLNNMGKTITLFAI